MSTRYPGLDICYEWLSNKSRIPAIEPIATFLQFALLSKLPGQMTGEMA